MMIEALRVANAALREKLEMRIGVLEERMREMEGREPWIVNSESRIVSLNI